MRRLPDLGILDPHACELADVEEAPVHARAPVEVEELRAPERVAPERVLLLARRHVIRDDVEDDPQAGLVRRLAERAELVLAAELVRDPGGVDDVVAMGRARARLQRGREVEV
ncbi:MAG TPA: hypothetical protein VNI55_00955 [Gaiellaceae bacterium]|nr:hypothetical protein [Gaiellaceae bacterium]